MEWIPRDQNEEADALTNGRFEDFDPRNRIEVDMDRLNWLLLPQMMVVSEDIHRRVAEKREQKKKERQETPQGQQSAAQRSKRLRPGERLCARDPW